MTLVQEILVESLAFADALHEPIREPMASHWPATWVLRWRYPRCGLPWRGGGDKRHERALTEAVKGGWLVRRRASRKTIGVRLTTSGLAEAWRLIGVHPHTALIVTRECARLGPDRRWVAEIHFNRGKGWGDEHASSLKEIQAFHRHARTSGYIDSNCDSHGRVGYRCMEIGRSALAEAARQNGHADPGEEVPEPDPETLELYDRSYMESINWLNSQTNVSVGARGEIGQIPLPTSAWLTTEDAYRGP